MQNGRCLLSAVPEVWENAHWVISLGIVALTVEPRGHCPGYLLTWHPGASPVFLDRSQAAAAGRSLVPSAQAEAGSARQPGRF